MIIDLDKYRRTRRLAESIPFGEWLMIARKNQGLTQEQLGNRVGCSQPIISRWEIGQLEVGPDDAASIAIALNNPGLLEKYCAQCPVCKALEKLTLQPKPAA